ncbi:hypothetical protein OG206_17675 [Streptomyces sp. NBC_01341]|uniref:hypothetical protein n=1 Tax=Streptomyces sp. NBC_01341 TaxID=2903831 RepID=UPI002E15443C|nr:hypothetical protein OG206_17675 [Streptomyces sp. NBC_01341]
MDTDSADTPPTGTGPRIALIDDLLARPYPAGEESEDSGVRSSGPGHHLLILRASRDFWDDRSPELVEPAEQEIEADFSVLATALSERWGEPETVELWPFLDDDPRDEDGTGTGPAPEPMGQLCNLAGSMQVWRVPGSTRWLGLAVGQADPEFPIWLLAAVGEVEALPA